MTSYMNRDEVILWMRRLGSRVKERVIMALTVYRLLNENGDVIEPTTPYISVHDLRKIFLAAELRTLEAAVTQYMVEDRYVTYAEGARAITPFNIPFHG